VTEEETKEKLYQEGLNYFKSGDYFEAHESWEDLWSDFYLEDRKFIQGLIQLSVSFVHLERGNINGAKSLLNKSKEKFQLFSGTHRNVNLELLLGQIKVVNLAYDKIDSLTDFDWNLVPNLEII
jgi:predicted metal-dependent hydrolase